MNSPPPDTRRGALSKEEVDKVVSEIIKQGARIEMRDARFTALQGWAWVAIGGIVIAGIGTAISQLGDFKASLGDLSRNVALLVQQNGFKDRIDAQQDRHMENTDAQLEEVKKDQRELRQYVDRFHQDQRNGNGR